MCGSIMSTRTLIVLAVVAVFQPGFPAPRHFARVSGSDELEYGKIGGTTLIVQVSSEYKRSTTEGPLMYHKPYTAEKNTELPISATLLIYNTTAIPDNADRHEFSDELQTSSSLPKQCVSSENQYPELKQSDKDYPITQVTTTQATSPEQSASTANETSTLSMLGHTDGSLPIGETENKMTLVEPTESAETVDSSVSFSSIGAEVNLEYTTEHVSTISSTDFPQLQPVGSTYPAGWGSESETAVNGEPQTARVTDSVVDNPAVSFVMSTSLVPPVTQELSTIQSNTTVTESSPLAVSSDLQMTELPTVGFPLPDSDGNSETWPSVGPNTQTSVPSVMDGLNVSAVDGTSDSLIDKPVSTGENDSETLDNSTETILLPQENRGEPSSEGTLVTPEPLTIVSQSSPRPDVQSEDEPFGLGSDFVTPTVMNHIDTTISEVESSGINCFSLINVSLNN